MANGTFYGENNSSLRMDEDEVKVPDDYQEIEENEVDLAVDSFAHTMNLEVLYKGKNRSVHISTLNINRPGLQLAGYYEHFSAERVQVMGEMELAYLSKLTAAKRQKACDELLSKPIPCLVISTNLNPCAELLAAAKKYDRVIYRSSLRTTMIMNELSLYFNNILAPFQTVHGVLMDIYGVGVLIIGDSGVGKSETALELVQRGHRLVADDAVYIRRIGDALTGSSPAVIRYFMEVRGIGIIDVRAMYGAGAVQLFKQIDLVVRLENWDDTREYDRLGSTVQYHSILGVKRHMYVIPIKPGRNLSIILEAASRNYRLKSLGQSALDELNNRLKSR